MVECGGGPEREAGRAREPLRDERAAPRVAVVAGTPAPCSQPRLQPGLAATPASAELPSLTESKLQVTSTCHVIMILNLFLRSRLCCRGNGTWGDREGYLRATQNTSGFEQRPTPSPSTPRSLVPPTPAGARPTPPLRPLCASRCSPAQNPTRSRYSPDHT